MAVNVIFMFIYFKYEPVVVEEVHQQQ